MSLGLQIGKSTEPRLSPKLNADSVQAQTKSKELHGY